MRQGRVEFCSLQTTLIRTGRLAKKQRDGISRALFGIRIAVQCLPPRTEIGCKNNTGTIDHSGVQWLLILPMAGHAVERWAVAEERKSLNQAWLDSRMGQVGSPYLEQINALFGNGDPLLGNRVSH
jgi:hypothetical protein